MPAVRREVEKWVNNAILRTGASCWKLSNGQILYCDTLIEREPHKLRGDTRTNIVAQSLPSARGHAR
jgi:hypothetical protein